MTGLLSVVAMSWAIKTGVALAIVALIVLSTAFAYDFPGPVVVASRKTLHLFEDRRFSDRQNSLGI